MSILTFRTHGFLSENLVEWTAKLRSENSELFRLVDRTNELCQKRVYELEPKEDLHPLLIATLYARCLSNYQGVIVCSERGMMVEATIIARALLEAVFCIRAIWRHPQLAQRYADEDVFIREKYLNKHKQLESAGKTGSSTSDQVKDLERQLNDQKGRLEINGRLSTLDWATYADMSHEYITAYAIFSADCHVYARKLAEQHLVLNSEGNLEHMKFEPTQAELPRIVLSSTEWALMALVAASETMKIAVPEEYSKICSEIRGLAVAYEFDDVR